jgi:lipopolysaccharide export LptBFGC system permease protein LptF
MFKKKIFLSVCSFILATVVFIACQKNQAENSELQIPDKFSSVEKKMITQFLNSSEYSRVAKATFKDFGKLDLTNSSIDYVENNQNKPVLNLVFMSSNKVRGFLQVIPIKKSIDNVLPNNEHYAMLLVNYKKYNTDSKTGDIELVDLNYDNFLAASLKVNNASIEEIKGNDMPTDILTKYSSLKKKADLGNPIYSLSSVVHPCDKNGNGNIGFGECMSCMTSACNGEPTCAVFCAIVNVAGIGTSTGGQCTISMLAACTYIAIAY